jgi:hypothetical protein
MGPIVLAPPGCSPSPGLPPVFSKPIDAVAAETDPRRLAYRRRLGDGQRVRWGWALASGLPVLGIPVVVLHGVTRRTMVPVLYGIGALASVGFALLTVVGAPQDPSSRSWSPRSGVGLLALLACTGSFALGHKLGQDRAARDAEKWFRLDL